MLPALNTEFRSPPLTPAPSAPAVMVPLFVIVLSLLMTMPAALSPAAIVPLFVIVLWSPSQIAEKPSSTTVVPG